MLFQLSDSSKTVIQQLVEKSDFDLLKKKGSANWAIPARNCCIYRPMATATGK